MADFNLKIMIACFGTHLDFLDLKGGLFLLCFLLFFGQFIFVTTVIHYFADRRIRIRRNLYQIKPEITGTCQGFMERKNTELIPFGVYQPDFLCFYSVVDIDFIRFAGLGYLFRSSYLLPPHFRKLMFSPARNNGPSDFMTESVCRIFRIASGHNYRFPEIKFHCVIGRRYTKEYDLRPASL